MHPISLQALKFDISYQKKKKKTDINQNTKNPTTVRSGHQRNHRPRRFGFRLRMGFSHTTAASSLPLRAARVLGRLQATVRQPEVGAVPGGRGNQAFGERNSAM